MDNEALMIRRLPGVVYYKGWVMKGGVSSGSYVYWLEHHGYLPPKGDILIYAVDNTFKCKLADGLAFGIDQPYVMQKTDLDEQYTYIPDADELVICVMDEPNFKIGDGKTVLRLLPYVSEEQRKTCCARYIDPVVPRRFKYDVKATDDGDFGLVVTEEE